MKLLFYFILFLNFSIYAQEIESFRIYNSKGKKVNTKRLIKELQKKDIILFGELHNNPIAHWLELKIAQELHKTNSLILGAEMFETDQQPYLNAYLNNEITQQNIDSNIRLWPNYKTDYKPLVDFAKENQIPFIATNAPQRFSTMVYREGLEKLESSLTESEKIFLPPLPFIYNPELPGYKAMLSMFGDAQHANKNLPKAQALKDATMAHFILKNWGNNITFLHFNGDYHSRNYEGIYWYLTQKNTSAKITTISTVEQENVLLLEKDYLNSADYIIVVDQDMTKTY